MFLLSALLGACASAVIEEHERLILALSPLPPPRPDPTNRFADDPAAAAFGAVLFSDRGLSFDGTVSCATCHVPEQGFTDGRALPVALGRGRRNTPSVQTVAWQTWFFWDGRADSAWAQAPNPLRNPVEMGADAGHLRARVLARWVPEYTHLFGPVGLDADAVMVNLAKALAAYERTLRPPESRLDTHVAARRAGDATTGLTRAELRGLDLFVGRAGCVNCHHGPLLTDGSFHNLGLPADPVDRGRQEGAPHVLADRFNCRGAWSDAPTGCDELRYLDPRYPDWAGAFKTPSLRGVRHTAPYMHDGSMPDLRAVVEFYNLLPGEPPIGHRELTLAPLLLSEDQKTDLLAFLEVL